MTASDKDSGLRSSCAGVRRWRALPGVIFLAFLGLYALTLQRGVSWQDSGIFQHRLLTGEYVDLGGGALAVVHPWYLFFGNLFTKIFSAPWRIFAVNLFSALGAATTLALLATLLLSLGGRVSAALAAATTLGLSHMFWWLATIAEVYTWSLAFLLLELIVLLRICRGGRGRDDLPTWCLLMAVNGMHASLHNVALLNLPIYAFLWLTPWRWRDRPAMDGAAWRRLAFSAPACALAWLAGAWLLVRLFATDMAHSGSFFTSLKSLLVGEKFGATVLGTGRVDVRLAFYNYAIALLSLAAPAWLLALAAWRGRRDDHLFKRLLLAMTVIHTLFWVRYFVPDQATFMLPTLGLGAVWLGLGAQWCTGRHLLRLVATGVVLQLGLPLVVTKVAAGRIARGRELPFRNEVRYWALPWKHTEASAQRFAEAVAAQMRPGDILYGDLTAINPIVAARAAGDFGTGGWRLISEWSGEDDQELPLAFDAALASGARAYVVSPVARYTPETLLARFEFTQDGVLWRARPMAARAAITAEGAPRLEP